MVVHPGNRRVLSAPGARRCGDTALPCPAWSGRVAQSLVRGRPQATRRQPSPPGTGTYRPCAAGDGAGRVDEALGSSSTSRPWPKRFKVLFFALSRLGTHLYHSGADGHGGIGHDSDNGSRPRHAADSLHSQSRSHGHQDEAVLPAAKIRCSGMASPPSLGLTPENEIAFSAMIHCLHWRSPARPPAFPLSPAPVGQHNLSPAGGRIQPGQGRAHIAAAMNPIFWNMKTTPLHIVLLYTGGQPFQCPHRGKNNFLRFFEFSTCNCGYVMLI
jgi:hypothetical protein